MLYDSHLLDMAMNIIKEEIIKDLSESAAQVRNNEPSDSNDLLYDSFYSD